jgi:hypothetical protein
VTLAFSLVLGPVSVLLCRVTLALVSLALLVTLLLAVTPCAVNSWCRRPLNVQVVISWVSAPDPQAYIMHTIIHI